jgi:hypothetical protein
MIQSSYRDLPSLACSRLEQPMPSISAILVTPDTLSTLARTLDCLRAQTVSHEIEIVLVGSEAAVREAEANGLARAFGGFRSVTLSQAGLTSEARAQGIRAATAPLVVLTEDHSWPQPVWAEALIRAHHSDCAVAGPAVRNANPRSALSWANFLIEYSEWMAPAAGRDCDHLPGHNSAYKRDVLLAFGPDLGTRLEAESQLHWHLRANGSRLRLAADAITEHLNFSRLLPSCRLRFAGGRLFAGMRRLPWPMWRRLAYGGGSVLLPCLRFARILHRLREPGRLAIVPWPSLPLAFGLLVIDAAGECAGYLAGAGRAAASISSIDFHREAVVNRRDRREFGLEPQ